jgi:hypothetical protein
MGTVITVALAGGPLDGEMIAINVEDPNDPPMFHDIGYRPNTPGAPAVMQTYRRMSRNPVVKFAWDYEATDDAWGIADPP